MIPRSEQVDAIRRLVRESVTAVDALVPTALRSVMPALVQARDELRADLQSWLATAKNGADRFTAADKQGALRALEGALERVADLQPAMASALVGQRHATGPLAIHNLDNEVRRLSAIFGGGVPTIPNIKAAAILAQGDKLLWKRHETSARRYAGAIGDDLKHLLAVGVAKGETFDQLVNRLRRIGSAGRTARPIEPGADSADIAGGLFGRYRWWAERLVRTEGMATYNILHDESIAYANENRPDGDEEYLRRWDASMDSRVCYECAALDGTVTTIDGTFKGGVSAPPLHPCCFLPGTRVGARVVAATRSHYSGDAIDIQTASGKRLRVTPNHPVATTRGFIRASSIRKGDRVLGQRGDIWRASCHGITTKIGHQNEPPTIEEVFDALAVASPPIRTAAAPDDFHGDAAGMDGHVDVVRAFGVLHGGARADGLSDLALPPADLCHACGVRLGDEKPVLSRVPNAASGIVGLGGLPFALLERHAGPLQRLSIGLPAQGNAPSLEPRTERASSDACIIGNLLERLAGEIALDEVVEIRNIKFTGHVYDLQTETGWIVSEGIYSSNCRCVVLAWLRRWGNIKGETQVKGDVPTPKPARPAPPKEEQATPEHHIGMGRIGVHEEAATPAAPASAPVPSRERVTEAQAEEREWQARTWLAKQHIAREEAARAEAEANQPRGTTTTWRPGDELRRRQVVTLKQKTTKELEEEERQREAAYRARQELQRARERAIPEIEKERMREVRIEAERQASVVREQQRAERERQDRALGLVKELEAMPRKGLLSRIGDAFKEETPADVLRRAQQTAREAAAPRASVAVKPGAVKRAIAAIDRMLVRR